VDEPRYEKGDRVCVRSAHGLRLPGVAIGYYVDWDVTAISPPRRARVLNLREIELTRPGWKKEARKAARLECAKPGRLVP
jgi:hypothetical protein